MRFSENFFLACGSTAVALILSTAASAEKLDLSREAPVPAGEQIPLVDFIRPTLLQEPKLNPSGTHIAALVTSGADRHALLVADLKTNKLEGYDAGGENDIYDVTWLNDKRLIFSVTTRKGRPFGLLAGDIGDLRSCFALLQDVQSSIVAVPPKNRLRPLVGLHSGGLNTSMDAGMVATINTDIRMGTIINFAKEGVTDSDVAEAKDNNDRHIVDRIEGPKGTFDTGFLANKEGKLEYGFTATDGLYTMHRLVGNGWEKCPVDLEEIDVVGSGNERGQLVVAGPRQEGKPRALQFMDGATGKLGDVLLQDTAYDFNGWLYRDPASRDVVGAMYERNGPRSAWFNESYRALQKVLDGFFPGLVVRIIGSDEGGKLFLVTTFSDRQPPVYNWVDLEKHTVGLFKKSRPWIDPARMQGMNVMKFKTRDGRQLDAYVTLPAGASKKNPPPLVVLAHAGPLARDNWGFNGQVQFLASRGYAVLQPNYRGSPGYGWMFPKTDEWEFRKMSDDVTDAVKTLIAAGVVDAGRVAIMGTAFGGYLAVSGVVNEPALYRCAVTVSGTFDWEQLINDNKIYKYNIPTFQRMVLKLGDPKKDPQRFESIAPVRQVDQVRVPVFVAYGGDNAVAEISQSKRLISELERHNVPHESLVVGNDWHGIAHLDNQVELYSRIEAFLAKNLASRSPSTAAP